MVKSKLHTPNFDGDPSKGKLRRDRGLICLFNEFFCTIYNLCVGPARFNWPFAVVNTSYKCHFVA